MGCDIHLVIQRQETDGQWREVQCQKVYSFLGETPVEGIPLPPKIFDARNYDLFGILADVRNGRGFAGVDTGDAWPSIAADRGLPPDFDPEAILPDQRGEANWLGDHSFTWVTLDELQAYPWDLVVVHHSVGRCISGPDVVIYDPLQYQEAQQLNRLAASPYIRVAWNESARSATNDWPGQILPWLESLAEGRPLRLVMGFDS